MELDDWDELGPPEIRSVPTGHPRLRVAAIVAGALVVVALVAGAGAWLLTRPAPTQAPAPAAVTTDSVNVTESFVVTASGTATGTSGAPAETSTPAATGTPTPGAPSFDRAAKVAYRRDGALWVADESGANERRVVASGSGAFALSPDAVTLAFVDGGTKTLAVADVATSRVTTVGPADVRTPVWSPSSTWLAYTSDGAVRRVSRSGGQDRYLGEGNHVAIGPDALAYAFSSGSAVTYYDSAHKQKRITAKGRVDDLALASDRLFYASGGAARSTVALRAVKLDGTDDKQLRGAPADAEAGRYDELALSPDGAWLAYAAAGDDMHSRVRAIRTDGTNDAALSLRHDDYLLRWSSDGVRLFFIDGNVLQGDATQLMSIKPDATQRAIVLKGAGM